MADPYAIGTAVAGGLASIAVAILTSKAERDAMREQIAALTKRVEANEHAIASAERSAREGDDKRASLVSKIGEDVAVLLDRAERAVANRRRSG